MRPIAPRTGAPEITIAEDQEEYQPITIAVHRDPHIDGAHRLLTRYTFTPEERHAIANGEDVYFAQLNFGNRMVPIHACVGPGWYAEDGRTYE